MYKYILSVLFLCLFCTVVYAKENCGTEGVINQIGKVISHFDSSEYTYVQIDKKNKKTWVAMPKTKISKGKYISFPDSEPIIDFVQKGGRKFDEIFFTTKYQYVNEICASNNEKPSSHASAAETRKEPSYDINFIFGTVIEGNTIAGASEPSTYCSVYSGKTLNEGAVLLISGTYACESTYPKESVPFYEILINGKSYYIKQSEVKLSESDKKRLDAMSADVVSDYRNKAISLSLNIRLKQLNEVSRAIEKNSKHGLTLLKHNIYDTSEYTDGTGFSVSVSNPTKKTIKYISFTIIGYNSVNDPVSGGNKRGTSITVKGVGPIEPNRSGSYDWEYLWLTDLVQTHKITSIRLEYMDGSKRTIKNIKDITLAPEHYLTMSEEE